MFINKNLLRRDERYIDAATKIPNVTITPDIRLAGNIYKGENAPTEISFKAKVEKPVTLECTLCYTSGKSEILLSKKVLKKSDITVKLPDFTDVYGVFRIEVTAIDENGRSLGTEHIPFSHIRVGERTGLKRCGACTHYIYHDEERSRICGRLMADCGFSKFRDDFIWRNCEIEKGKVFIPQNYENMINFFVDEGLEANLLFLYANPNHDDDKAPYTEEGRAAYAHYCATVAEHYKGRVNHFEIWNEYNLFGEGGGGFNPQGAPPEVYVEMLKEAYTAIKKVNPEAVVTAGVTCSPHFYWVRRVMEAGAYDYFDEFSIHPYCSVPDSTYPDNGQGQAEANVQGYIDIISEYGPPKPVWISEIGWTTDVAEGGSTREDQAACLARLCALTETGETISKLTMYDFEDDYGDRYNMEAHWGLVERPNTTVPHAAKESYAAVSQLNFMIGGKELLESKITDEIKNITFTDNTLLLWSLNGAKTVKIAATAPLDYYDMYGNLTRLVPENGVVKLVVNENPCYLANGVSEVVSATAVPYENIDQPYTVTLIPDFKEDGWYLQLKLKAWQNSLEGRLRLEIPELDISGNYSGFLLNYGQSFTAEFKIGEADIYRTYGVITDVNLINGVRDVDYQKVSFMAIPKRGQEKTLFTLNAQRDYKAMIPSAPAPEKLNADISLSYDEKYFYLDAVVEDETHLQVGTSYIAWKDIWDGDNIEFMLQPLHDGNKAITRFSDIGLALTSNTNEPVAWRWRTLSNRSYGIFRSCDFKAERREGVTEYHAKIAWKELLPPAVSLNDCPVFGFALRVGYANSTPHSLDGYMQLYGGIGSWRKPLSYMPQEFGTFILK